MERVVRLHIEKLPEGVYLATSDDIQGLVAQGRTINETIETARDVVHYLTKTQSNRDSTFKDDHYLKLIHDLNAD